MFTIKSNLYLMFLRWEFQGEVPTADQFSEHSRYKIKIAYIADKLTLCYVNGPCVT